MSDKRVTLADLDEESDESGASTSGWRQIEMGELAEYQNGNAFSKSEWTDDGYPIIRIQNLTGEQEEFNYFEGELEERYRVETGDLLLSWSATIDVFEWDGPVAALNQHIYRVDSTDLVNEIFFRFMLEDLLPRLEALSHGSTMKHVRKIDLVNLDANIPPLEEQREIASVLYTVDQAIQKTDQVKDAIKRVEKGVRSEVLARGINEGGRLRVGPEENPDAYREHRLGSIPKSWDIKQISEVVLQDRPVTYGIVQPGEYIEGGVPLIRGQNYINGWEPLDELFRVDPELHEEYSRCITRPGDVLLCIAGANTGAVNIVPEWIEEANLTQTTARIAVDETVAIPEFVRFVLDSPFVNNQIHGWTRGSAQPGLNLGRVEKFQIPLPSLDEQDRIVEMLMAIRNQSSIEEETIRRLRHVKKGLMQDLLTGEVRTHDKDIKIVEEVLANG